MNGWGPVERDSSVGEQAAGDGRTITIAGASHAKGPGTNALSDIQLYLGGNCSRLTAEVGVDDETGGAGTVTFSVIADGRTLVTTPTVRGRQAAVPIESTSAVPRWSTSRSVTAATATATTTATGRPRH